MSRGLTVGAMVLAVAVTAVWLFDPPSSRIDLEAMVGHTPTEVVGREPEVPVLPFPDNPDPELCGKPEPWGAPDDRAWLSGVWEGDLIEPDVLLYDSHLRLSISGSAPHGTEVQIVLFQANPVLDFYFVETPGVNGASGWVPGPFLSFQPVEH